MRAIVLAAVLLAAPCGAIAQANDAGVSEWTPASCRSLLKVYPTPATAHGQKAMIPDIQFCKAWRKHRWSQVFAEQYVHPTPLPQDHR